MSRLRWRRDGLNWGWPAFVGGRFRSAKWDAASFVRRTVKISENVEPHFNPN